MGVNCYMDGGYTSILGPGFMWDRTSMEVDTSIECRWYTIIVILIEVKCDLNFVNLVLGGDGMQILRLGSEMGPGLGWDTNLETGICSGGTRMELRSNSLDLDGCETWNGWMWDANIMTWLQHELKNFGTRMDVKRCMEWGGGRGHGCRWGRTWMEVRHT